MDARVDGRVAAVDSSATHSTVDFANHSQSDSRKELNHLSIHIIIVIYIITWGRD